MTETPNNTTPVKAAPIPLVTGTTFTAEDGTTREATAAALTLTAEDGTTHTINLEFRHNGWWATTS